MIYIKPILNTNKLNLEQFEERKKKKYLQRKTNNSTSIFEFIIL